MAGIENPSLLRLPAQTVVVADVVESVRLMEFQSDDFIERWLAFSDAVLVSLPSRRGSRYVKSLGDGLMLRFDSAAAAVQCAIDMQRLIHRANEGRTADQWICLRIGAHCTDIVVGDRDIYGSGVNLASRVATLAAPGEIVVTSAVREQLTDGLDADIDDMGDCCLKHVPHPVRAYRISEPGADPVARLAQQDHCEMRPAVAIVPFACRSPEPHHVPIGDAIADEIIARLSRSGGIAVISRLSTAAFANRNDSLERMGSSLGASYLLSGAFHVFGNKLFIQAELAEVRSARVVWAGSMRGEVQALFTGQVQMLDDLIEQAARVLLSRECERALTLPLPTLESYTLMLGASTLMHRCASIADFQRAHDMLEHLCERHRRHGTVHAWLAKWHVLRVVQGWSPDPLADARRSLECVNHALDLQPHNALAMTMLGQVHGYLNKDPHMAIEFYAKALEANPNEPLAWLYSSTANAWIGNANEGIRAGEEALRLSPLDPLRYYFDSLASVAYNVAGQYDEAIRLCKRSLRANRAHTATYRGLAIAQVLGGQVEEGRKTVAELLRLEPGLTVQTHAQRYPGRMAAHAALFSDALATAGVPH